MMSGSYKNSFDQVLEFLKTDKRASKYYEIGSNEVYQSGNQSLASYCICTIEKMLDKIENLEENE